MANIRKLESELWEAADLLRADSKVTSQEYCMPVLGLIFLRYAYSRFKFVEADILKDRPVRNGRVLPVEAADFKTKSAIFLPEEARYSYLLNLPDNAKVGEAINHAMELIEEQSTQLKGILPKNYTTLQDELLRELLRIFNNSALNDIKDDIIGRIYEYFSQIDFDRLRKEFERAQNKNLLFKDLQDIVEERLNKMMANNPLRTNYYERYQQIVDEYNKDNEKDSIAIIFENLMKLVNEMDAEQKRYVREGFDSDEELTMFDLLVKDSLSKEEIKKVKKLAQTMLAKIKARIHELDHWRDKEETQSIISVLIRDILWAELPESYDDAAIADYRNQIYEYVYNAYPAA